MIWIIILATLLAAISLYDFSWSNVTNNIRNEVVFEERHKSYGAYALRVENGKVVWLSFAGVAILLVGTLFASKMIKFGGENGNKGIMATEFDLSRYEDPEKPEDVVKPEVTETQKPPVLDLAKILNPKADNETTDTANTQDDLEKKLASNVDMKGDTTNGDPNKRIMKDLPVDPTGGNGGSTCTDCEIGDLTELPEFKGMGDYLMKNLKITAEAREIGLKGRIYVEFTVLRDGSVSNVKVKTGLLPSQDREAARVIREMPAKWVPEKINGKPVNVRLIQPIKISVGGN